MARQLMASLPQLTHRHSQLTHSRSCGPALTLSWVSIHSEILGRNSAVESVRRQRRDLLTPSVVWASTGVRTHAARILWVSRPALNPPGHKSIPAARQTESDPALTTHVSRITIIFVILSLYYLQHSHSRCYNKEWDSLWKVNIQLGGNIPLHFISTI